MISLLPIFAGIKLATANWHTLVCQSGPSYQPHLTSPLPPKQPFPSVFSQNVSCDIVTDFCPDNSAYPDRLGFLKIDKWPSTYLTHTPRLYPWQRLTSHYSACPGGPAIKNAVCPCQRPHTSSIDHICKSVCRMKPWKQPSQDLEHVILT